MKIYKMPENLSAIIFDIDSTLYTNSAYAFEQVDVQIRHFAQKSGLSDRNARNKISEWRRDWSRKNGGKKISLGNTLVHFGVTIEESIKMRENLLFPEQFLSIDNRLIQLIARLREKYSLICVTNNPVLPARKTLSALGIAELIPDIIGLDTCKKSKPNKDVFILAAQMMNVPFQNILSIGDRFDMDLAIPLEMGMGAALVSGVSGVYDLCEKLLEG
ncbi:MAG: HAD family hydrolase [Treponema sp.]|nr:HAD family hydrolase [Treponema sp.]